MYINAIYYTVVISLTCFSLHKPSLGRTLIQTNTFFIQNVTVDVHKYNKIKITVLSKLNTASNITLDILHIDKCGTPYLTTHSTHSAHNDPHGLQQSTQHYATQQCNTFNKKISTMI